MTSSSESNVSELLIWTALALTRVFDVTKANARSSDDRSACRLRVVALHALGFI